MNNNVHFKQDVQKNTFLKFNDRRNLLEAYCQLQAEKDLCLIKGVTSRQYRTFTRGFESRKLILPSVICIEYRMHLIYIIFYLIEVVVMDWQPV